MNPSRTLRIEAISLALVAGYVDGYALRVFGIYVSFMSGNTTMAGIEAGQGHFLIALIPALAIAGFVLGSFVGNWFAHSQLPHSQRLLFIASAVLIAGFVVLNLHISGNANRSLPMLSVAMGMINPAVTRIGGEPVSLTFVTGTLNKMANHLALGVGRARLPNAEGKWDTHFYRAALEASLWVGFLAGAILCGASSHFGVLELVPASLALLAFGLVDRGQTSTPSTQTR
ncbi:MAG TPA: YoaK family protein [Terriglobales bacterium]